MGRGADHIALALDVDRAEEALALADRLRDEVGLLKVGLELFTAEGPALVKALRARGARIFLDLKLHDIPRTAGQAARAAAILGVELLTVHAAGGAAMIAATREGAARGAKEAGLPAPTVVAVTVLTSLDDAALESIGLSGPCDAAALRLGKLALSAGAHGLVCSPREVAPLRAALGAAPLLVVPGIRPAGAAPQDQVRAGTPERAMRDGASLLVVGRPIRESSDPVSAARAIAREVEEALGD